MKDLAIERHLTEETRKQGVVSGGEVYSLHITDDEVIITDFYDYTKIYCIYSLDYYNSRLSAQLRRDGRIIQNEKGET